MKYCEKNQEPVKEESPEVTKKNSKNSLPSLKIDLNVIEENEENVNENQKILLEEEESLGFNSNYKTYATDYRFTETSIKEKGIFPYEFKRKSTLSTSISLSENFQETYGLSPAKSLESTSSNEITPQHIFFGRERFYSTPLTNYFDGTDNYFRELNPEKNDYKKSNNYIEKGKFLQDSIKSNNLEQIEFQKTDISTIPKLNNDLCYNLTESYTPNNKSTPTNQSSDNLTIPLATVASSTPKYNGLYGKFDFPMYCVGYCKSNIYYIIIN